MQSWGIVFALLTIALMVRPALTEKRTKPSDEKVALALRTALRVAASEGRSFDPEKETITIRRRGRSWSFRFDMLPDQAGRVLPDSTFVVGVHDDGQVTFIPGL